MGSRYLDVQDGESREKETRVSWDVLADPAPDLPPEKPSGTSHRHRDRKRVAGDVDLEMSDQDKAGPL